MNVSEPTRSTREYLRARDSINAKLRKELRGTSRKERKEAKARALVRPVYEIERRK
jgi:hypothetical protein